MPRDPRLSSAPPAPTRPSGTIEAVRAVLEVAPVTLPIETKTTDLVTSAQALAVKTEADYASASKYKDVAKAILADISSTFDGHISAAYKAHKDLIATKKKFSDPVELVVSKLNFQMSTFTQEQNRKAREEEARLAEESRKHNESIAVAQAAQLELQGQHEAAAQVVEEAINAPTPTVMTQRFNPNDFGRSTRTAWKWRIVSLKDINVAYLAVVNDTEISTTGIGALVRAMKNKEQVERMVGGILAYEETITV